MMEEMNVKMYASHKTMTMLDAYHERIMARLGNAEA
jgi:hypothetical protein